MKVPNELIKRITAEISAIPLERIPDGSGHQGDTYNAGWINGLSMVRLYGTGYPDQLDRYPGIVSALIGLRIQANRSLFISLKLRQVMVNRLEAYSHLDIHADGPPKDYRYHLPIITNPHVRWWDEKTGYHTMKAGHWYGPVSYSGVKHSMENDGHTARIHLIVDLYSEGK